MPHLHKALTLADIFTDHFMKLNYYQYPIGQGKIVFGEMHQCLMEINFDENFLNTDNVFLKQIFKVLTHDKINPILLKNITRGIHYRKDAETIIIESPSFPTKFIEKGFFNDSSIEFGLGAGGINNFEGYVLNEDYYFFYFTKHPFSQWHKCNFTIDNIEFNSAEQYMMYSKAKLFEDKKIEEKILKSNDVREQKMLGRQIENFDKLIWEYESINFVYQGNKAKFSQNKEFSNLLISTIGTTIVEASPSDFIWGIGLSENEIEIKNINHWKGLNLLGIVLTELREELRGNNLECGFFNQKEFNTLELKK